MTSSRLSLRRFLSGLFFVAVVGGAGSIIAPHLDFQTDRQATNWAYTESCLGKIARAISAFQRDNQKDPDSYDDLFFSRLPTWRGPYLAQAGRTDIWGRAYLIRKVRPGVLRVGSLGPSPTPEAIARQEASQFIDIESVAGKGP